MTTIPGTGYVLSGKTIFSPEGKEVSPEQFLDKVKNKEISLTENSLTVLEGNVGFETMQSLRSLSGPPSSPGSILNKLPSDDVVMGDLCSLMKLIAQMSNDQRKSVSEVRHSQTGLQLDAMKQSIDELQKAATARLVAGIAGGVFTMGSGTITGLGSLGKFGGETVDAMLARGNSLSQILGGIGQIVGAGIERVSSEHDQNSKDWDIKAKKFEDQSGDSRDLENVIRETNQQAREILQQMQSSTSQTISKINSA
jgi:hypothetical protein